MALSGFANFVRTLSGATRFKNTGPLAGEVGALWEGVTKQQMVWNANEAPAFGDPGINGQLEFVWGCSIRGWSDSYRTSTWSVNTAKGIADLSSHYQVGGTKVVAARRTGWGAPTGTGTRAAFDTGTVTLPQLAQRLKAVIDDLTAHGLIGP